jgi:hypothetical protein
MMEKSLVPCNVVFQETFWADHICIPCGSVSPQSLFSRHVVAIMWWLYCDIYDLAFVEMVE